jgi:enoyl-[acyl-carrier protein] reductase III
LASHGARVLAGYFQNEAAAEEFRQEAAAKGYDCRAIKSNLMASTGIQTLRDHVVSQFGRLDVLIHNAATGVHKPLGELSQRHLSSVWQVNVGAFFELSLRLRPVMPRGSRIIAISSEGARKAVNHYGAVGSSKAGLEALCRQMAVEWAAEGVSVNLIAPGLLETDTLAVLKNADARVQQEIKSSPLGRMVRLEEVACLVHFLCSSASEGLLGQTIVMDGGKSISGFVQEQ